MDEAPKRRRWFAFSLRTLLLLVTVFCVWFGWWVESARRQRDVVAKIHEFGGMVIYDYQMVLDKQSSWPRRSRGNAKDPIPIWLQSLFGKDSFHRVASVIVGPGSLTKNDLDQLQLLLPNLYGLDFCGTRVEGKRMSDLTWLKNCPHLESLSLRATELDNDDLTALKDMKQLRSLTLYSKAIGDEGLKNISSLNALECLSLWGETISDQGLAHLEGLTNLTELELSSDSITDDGLVHLSRMSNLKDLDLRGTLVTSSGAAELHKTLPNCSISVGL